MIGVAATVVVGVPLAAWAFMGGGPMSSSIGGGDVVAAQEMLQPWLMMVMGVGFLAVSGWHRRQEKQQGTFKT